MSYPQNSFVQKRIDEIQRSIAQQKARLAQIKDEEMYLNTSLRHLSSELNELQQKTSQNNTYDTNTSDTNSYTFASSSKSNQKHHEPYQSYGDEEYASYRNRYK